MLSDQRPDQVSETEGKRSKNIRDFDLKTSAVFVSRQTGKMGEEQDM